MTKTLALAAIITTGNAAMTTIHLESPPELLPVSEPVMSGTIPTPIEFGSGDIGRDWEHDLPEDWPEIDIPTLCNQYGHKLPHGIRDKICQSLPEPSTSLLAILPVLGLVRRKR